MGTRWCLLASIATVLTLASARAQSIKSFPQAEGFGAEATGGRGGSVYHVTSLSDSGAAGTLRYGIESLDPDVPVTIVFDVGGWINLNENLGVTRDNITIAGQTAPGGVGVRNRKFSIGGDDIVVRHVQFAYGRTAAARNDTINVNNNSSDVIFDHVAALFARDEGFSAQSTNLTLQWSTVSYGLHDHSAGSLLEEPTNLSFHHNVWAHNHTRNPKARVQGAFDYIHNVVYDYDIGFIAGDSGTEDYYWPNNFDGNYFITGPGDSGIDMIVLGHDWNTGLYFGTNAYDGDGDSQHDGDELTRDSRTLGGAISGTYTWVDEPYPVADPIWREATPEAAYQRVLEQFGPNPHARNDLLEYIAASVAGRTGRIISDQDELPVSGGGWGTITGGTAPADADSDGMPDEWEARHGTPVTRPSQNGDFDDDGYTDLEEYLNDLAAFKATGPLEFSGDGRYAEWPNWTRRWEPSRVDDVHIDNGTATVDAVGQKAGTLRVGAAAESEGRLAVTDGWLEVTGGLEVGPGGSGEVEQTGGAVRVLGGGVEIENGAYRLLGGSLHTPRLSKGAEGVFLLEGGELHADVVTFDLQNDGGVLAPGGSIGQTHVEGDLTLAGGTLRIELASEEDFDRLIVDGHAELGGALEVQLADGFAPTSGSWPILSAGAMSGQFESVTEGFSVQQSGGGLMLVVGSGALAGDYNADGVVDAGDYAVWRDTLGAAVAAGAGADGDASGVVDAGDYQVWRTQMTASAVASSLPAVLPDPAGASLAWVAAGAIAVRARCR